MWYRKLNGMVMVLARVIANFIGVNLRWLAMMMLIWLLGWILSVVRLFVRVVV